MGRIKELSLYNDTFLNEVKGLFEANGETQLFQEDRREKKKKSKTKELDWTGPAAGSQIKQSLGLFRITFGEKVKG